MSVRNRRTLWFLALPLALTLMIAVPWGLSSQVVEEPIPGEEEPPPPPPPPQVCWCTNLGGVTVICPACDMEPDVGRCFWHDQACQDAAEAGGIREFKQFHCTTGH